MTTGDRKRERILKYILKKKPVDFTAADIAKKLNLTARDVAGYLKYIPEVEVKNRRRYSHSESGNRYRLVPGCC